MSEDFLSVDQLKAMSRCHTKASCARWLREQGYNFHIARDGWPTLMWAAVEAKLMPATSKRSIRKTEPDFSAYDKTQKAA